MTTDHDLAQAILDTALDLGERGGWDAVHLHDIAAALEIPIADIQRCYPDKDGLAEAWFDRAESAMIAVAQTPGWLHLSPRERLFRTITGWLEALAVHKRPTLAMLRYKAQPDHLHLQLKGLSRISRTVQWIRRLPACPRRGGNVSFRRSP